LAGWIANNENNYRFKSIIYYQNGKEITNHMILWDNKKKQSSTLSPSFPLWVRGLGMKSSISQVWWRSGACIPEGGPNTSSRTLSLH
jgi:hypothetical protein